MLSVHPEENDYGRTLDSSVFDPYLYWYGVPTLFRCPHDPDPAKCDIGLIGVPHSSGNGTTERDQHLGPRAVRDMSMGYRRCHAEYRIDPGRWAQSMIWAIRRCHTP